jgi:hypothetical protein
MAYDQRASHNHVLSTQMRPLTSYTSVKRATYSKLIASGDGRHWWPLATAVKLSCTGRGDSYQATRASSVRQHNPSSTAEHIQSIRRSCFVSSSSFYSLTKAVWCINKMSLQSAVCSARAVIRASVRQSGQCGEHWQQRTLWARHVSVRVHCRCILQSY